MEGNTKSGNAPQSTGHVRVKSLAPIASSLFPVGSSRQGTKKKKTSAWSSRLTLLSRVLLYGSLPSASASLSPSLQQQKRCVVAISSDTPLSLQKANAETRVVRIITVVAVTAKKKEEEGENSSPIASERGEQKSLDVGKAMTEEREREKRAIFRRPTTAIPPNIWLEKQKAIAKRKKSCFSESKEKQKEEK